MKQETNTAATTLEQVNAMPAATWGWLKICLLYTSPLVGAGRHDLVGRGVDRRDAEGTQSHGDLVAGERGPGVVPVGSGSNAAQSSSNSPGCGMSRRQRRPSDKDVYKRQLLGRYGDSSVNLRGSSSARSPNTSSVEM